MDKPRSHRLCAVCLLLYGMASTGIAQENGIGHSKSRLGSQKASSFALDVELVSTSERFGPAPISGGKVKIVYKSPYRWCTETVIDISPTTIRTCDGSEAWSFRKVGQMPFDIKKCDIRKIAEAHGDKGKTAILGLAFSDIMGFHLFNLRIEPWKSQFKHIKSFDESMEQVGEDKISNVPVTCFRIKGLEHKFWYGIEDGILRKGQLIEDGIRIQIEVVRLDFTTEINDSMFIFQPPVGSRIADLTERIIDRIADDSFDELWKNEEDDVAMARDLGSTKEEETEPNDSASRYPDLRTSLAILLPEWSIWAIPIVSLAILAITLTILITKWRRLHSNQ